MSIRTTLREYVRDTTSAIRRFSWRSALAKPLSGYRWMVATLAEGLPSFLIAVPIGLILAATAYWLLLPRDPEVLRAVFAPRRIDTPFELGIIPYGQPANKPRLVIDVVRSHQAMESVFAKSAPTIWRNAHETATDPKVDPDTQAIRDAKQEGDHKTLLADAKESVHDTVLRDGKRIGFKRDGGDVIERMTQEADKRWKQTSPADARILSLASRPVLRLKEKKGDQDTVENENPGGAETQNSCQKVGYICRYIVRREGGSSNAGEDTPTVNDEADDSEAVTSDQEQYSNGQILVVEVRQVAAKSEGHLSAAVVVDIGMRVSGKDADEADWVRVPWHETKNIASEGSYLARFELDGGSWDRFLQFPFSGSPVRLSYPTSGQSVAEWIVGHFNDVSVSVNPDYKKSKLRHTKKELELVAGDLERLLDEDWGHLTADPYVSRLRVVNGVIQFCTVSAFFAALAILVCRIRMVRVDRGYLADCSKSIVAGPTESVFDRFSSWVETREKKHRVRWRHPSYVLQLYADAVAAAQGNAQDGQLPGFVNSFTGAQISRSDSNGFAWRFLVGSLAGLGFLGTVWGIGQALMGTGSVLSSELAKQQAGVMSVSMTLGTAFDTTFVALLLTLIVSAVGTVLVYLEESTIQSAGREFLARVAPYVGRMNVEGRVAETPPLDADESEPPPNEKPHWPSVPREPDRARRRYREFTKHVAYGFAAAVLGALVLNYVIKLLLF